ncbi:SAM-dependent DNA methyltransferase [uncultured Hyphomicrobium sp.]|uniref:Eco57I restriction-modification methylase domain-containing protein n=1 Tax=uncultured Hyphomicrobium sp. TaxID=194373 RepID=UPI0025DFEFCD|nr:SAM-dependent DNA methyltransferase [uncultured Hyphomicrobium sp.]
MAVAPWALVHEGDFFTWASNTEERFECASGNPPFIRYQSFSGSVREGALRYCASLGAKFSGLTSSWAPFLVATASLLKAGGRLSFVVPAEIGHAPYASPLMEYLVANFRIVHVVAVRTKLFPDLSEDCWLLHAEGFGGSTTEIRFTALDSFRHTKGPPRQFARVGVDEWRTVWNKRLRPYLLPDPMRELYQLMAGERSSYRLGDLARVGIGYVSGANDFFHLRPRQAEDLKIPGQFLHLTVRNGRALPQRSLTANVVDSWIANNDPVLLLKLPKVGTLPAPVRRYLETEEAHAARQAYKCRVRSPWYSVPDVQVPDFFLSYMSGREASLVRNAVASTCTNSVHSVRLKDKRFLSRLNDLWSTPFVQLSCELEGHPLGGGMLKLEPREATQVVLPAPRMMAELPGNALEDAISTMQQWRHYAAAA